MAMLYLQYNEDLDIYKKIIRICNVDISDDIFFENYYHKIGEKIANKVKISFRFIKLKL